MEYNLKPNHRFSIGEGLNIDLEVLENCSYICQSVDSLSYSVQDFESLSYPAKDLSVSTGTNVVFFITFMFYVLCS